MAKTNYRTINEYHRAFNGESLKRMKVIRKIIRDQVPAAEESISYQIPCFKYKGNLIYYSAFTNHITLSYPYSEAFWKHFRRQLEGYKTSKSAIQFPFSKPLDELFIWEIIAFRKNENDEKKK